MNALRQRKNPYDVEDQLEYSNESTSSSTSIPSIPSTFNPLSNNYSFLSSSSSSSLPTIPSNNNNNNNEIELKYKQLQLKNEELENKILYLKRQLENEGYNNNNNNNNNNNDLSDDKYNKRKSNFNQIIFDRGSWLIGLLLIQSFSSIILSEFDILLGKHPVLMYFLTMLIGAGGNAGNQAAVRMIREIALGNVTPQNRFIFVYRELTIAVTLAGLVGLTGFLRAIISSKTTMAEVFAVTIALIVIVIVSVLLGTALPLGLDMLKVDPAHSSTSIQVIMDILGVLLVCIVASLMLS